MITVETNFREQAKKKISDGKKEVKGNKEGAMKHAIADALISFADQDNEFARAICEGGSFADCMKAVAKGVGNSISDIDAIRKAVDFYFKGARVNFTMTISVNPHEAPAADPAPTPETSPTQGAETEKKSVLELSLDDLF